MDQELVPMIIVNPLLSAKVCDKDEARDCDSPVLDAYRRARQRAHPVTPRPENSNAQVEGSGTVLIAL